MENNKIDNNVGDKFTDVQFAEYQSRAEQALYDLVEYLRQELKTRPKDFVLFKLDEIAKQSDMDATLKSHIIKAINHPDRKFVVKFNTTKK